MIKHYIEVAKKFAKIAGEEKSLVLKPKDFWDRKNPMDYVFYAKTKIPTLLLQKHINPHVANSVNIIIRGSGKVKNFIFNNQSYTFPVDFKIYQEISRKDRSVIEKLFSMYKDDESVCREVYIDRTIYFTDIEDVSEEGDKYYICLNENSSEIFPQYLFNSLPATSEMKDWVKDGGQFLDWLGV